MIDETAKNDAVRTVGKIRRIVVDRASCIGARSCVLVASSTFAMDGENIAVITDPNGNDDETLKLAAESCPVLAIHLYDEAGNKVFPNE